MCLGCWEPRIGCCPAWENIPNTGEYQSACQAAHPAKCHEIWQKQGNIMRKLRKTSGAGQRWVLPSMGNIPNTGEYQSACQAAHPAKCHEIWQKQGNIMRKLRKISGAGQRWVLPSMGKHTKRNNVMGALSASAAAMRGAGAGAQVLGIVYLQNRSLYTIFSLNALNLQKTHQKKQAQTRFLTNCLIFLKNPFASGVLFTSSS